MVYFPSVASTAGIAVKWELQVCLHVDETFIAVIMEQLKFSSVSPFLAKMSLLVWVLVYIIERTSLYSIGSSTYYQGHV